MNPAHSHLVINHFPIIGVIFGFVFLVIGIFSRSLVFRRIAFAVFLASFIFGIFSNITGHSAEEFIEKLPDVNPTLIDWHEELASTFLWLLGILAFFSVTSFMIEAIAKKSTLSLNIVILIWTLFIIYFSTKVGTSGGEIRHPEIRNNSTQTIKLNQGKD
ncbi:MAG: DUF2231 domain-containing protein [Candidatus Kapaibacteriales bacterium]